MKARLSALDWPRLVAALDADGFANTGALLDADECAALRTLYADESRFRSRVIMQRHAFGRGEYQYFAAPLPGPVAALRTAFYARLAPVATAWAATLGEAIAYPPTLGGFLRRCRAAGQTRPTPLLLRYGAGDYNCLHRDLYGAIAFPLQVTLLLSAPGEEFDGGEFVLVEQRPRAQSKAEVVPLLRGEAVIFATDSFPRRGARGAYRARLRHGVSRIRRGERTTLGLIFHDAA